ncbi:hypothetical protein [Aminobacter niigataensis]|uniref:hypothetical protein n=1 Tax=Aminobacter niigataensis TaxID=83265 RepID=UPI0024CC6980|nr:hypothetical protein [Aminobacter niigataensis]CAI2936058.1 conserved protein of unknown function [Aminobacter niigataensis]
MSRPISLVGREIETKIDAAIKAEVAKGKKPSDMGRRDFEVIADAAMATMSPEARKQAAIAGLEHMAKGVFGEMIAEQLWQSGRGYGAPKAEIVSIASKMRFTPPEDAPEWLSIYREDIAECTLNRLDETYKSAQRFRALLACEPANAQLGEVALRKAATGDPLAQAFLAGRPQ